MKRLHFFSIIFLFISSFSFSQVAINADGSSPHPSAGLDVNFVNKGFLLPRMTYQQVTSIQAPAEGLLIYCTDCNPDGTGALSIYQGGLWRVFNLNCSQPPQPVNGTNARSLNQIVWNWGNIPIAVGFKWNTIDDFSTATDIGLVTSYTESGLDCWTTYTRYLWAYNSCGQSDALVLTDSTLMEPVSPAPTAATYNPTDTSIMWFWYTVPGAVGYKFNTVNDFNTAVDVSYLNFYWETGLTCLTSYTRYVWAYDDCGFSSPALLTGTTINNPPDVPASGNHVAAVNQIVWNWNPAADADGYKWNTTNNYNTATDMATSISKTETGLICNTSYTRYVWSYSECGVSAPVTLTKSTLVDPPAAPVAAAHEITPVQIKWKWNHVTGATGYKWNTTNNYSTAINVGSDTARLETGLYCNTSYTRYVWAYSDCGVSASKTLTQSTALDPPPAPATATHTPTPSQIRWNWHTVSAADGYKWNTVNDYATAIEMGPDTTRLETALSCNTSYTRYVWSYNECGISAAGGLTQSTSLNPPAAPVAATHVPTPVQITWNWTTVSGATGYKWNTTNNLATAQDLGNVTSKVETSLSCNTQYSRYVWAYSNCGTSASTSLLQSTSLNPPAPPAAGTHYPTLTQITWNWNTVSGATGYKWNTTNDYATAQDMSTATTKIETSLSCNTSYTRYVWAYSNCGVSSIASLNQATSVDPPAAPVAATHVATPTQITWKWIHVPNASGYKWNTTNNYATAINLGTDTLRAETGLTCNSAYTRYVWAYGNCGVSSLTSLTQSTALDPPAAPVASTHVPTATQITWNWSVVSGAVGYKWNTANDYSTAQDLGSTTSKTETGLNCNTSYTRYVWAYNNCGVSTQTSLAQSTSLNPPAAPVAGTHVPTATQITWNWAAVSGATGYKWNTSNNYGTAQDMGTALTKVETALTCNTTYNRYIWAYSTCGVSSMTTITQLTSLDPPATPTAGTHVSAPQQILWKWNTVPNATGYKWNSTNNVSTAIDLGAVLQYTQTGLTCNTSYTCYVWAYSNCGTSGNATFGQSTSLDPPASPVAATHVASGTQITWNWNTVANATGYKWNTANDYASATDMGTAVTKIETGLSCNTPYTRYIWAYSNCGVSGSATISQVTTADPPASPATATNVPSPTQVIWKWRTVTGATGYKWSATNNYATATNMGTDTTTTETGLICNTAYTRYVWAYNNCSGSTTATLSQSTSLDPPAAPVAGTHTPGLNDIQWNWTAVSGATGYKFNTTNDLATATDLGNVLTYSETSLTCNTSYTRYFWAYGNCGSSSSATFTASTALDPPASPVTGTHTATSYSVVWNWNTVSGATGYKWNTTNSYSTATDMGTGTSKTETGLLCNTDYTRYVWAYSNCGVSSAGTLTQVTSNETPSAPSAGTHIATAVQITWNWSAVSGASGYKWNTVDNFATAQDMLSATAKTETGLSCNTPYTRYVWAYNNCGNSASVTLTQTTTSAAPATPTAGTHQNDYTQIIWHWNTVSDAAGYKWSTTNVYANATDMGTSTAYTETGLTCGTSYTRYVWAYNSCGQSTSLTTSKSTVACFVCGNNIAKTHVAGDVAPVNKTVSYGTVTNVPGETTKCWITSNLGADHQATAVTDATEASAGWYWQFNLKQGYKHDGTDRTPNSSWLGYYAEYTNWTAANDPCTLELGNGWRLPTKLEWDHVDATGGWTTWNGPWTSLLKLHAAGRLNSTDGTLANRGLNGIYWSSTQSSEEMGWRLNFNSGACSASTIGKPYGFSVRCIKD